MPAPTSGEKVKSLSSLPILRWSPFLSLLETPEIRLELFLSRPGRAVDAGKHRVVLVATPVSASDVLQLESTQSTRTPDVRATTEVEELALAVDRDVAIFEVADDLQLVRVVLVETLGLLFRYLLALDREVPLDDLAHALLDARQVFVRYAASHLDVVEEAVLNRRP